MHFTSHQDDYTRQCCARFEHPRTLNCLLETYAWLGWYLEGVMPMFTVLLWFRHFRSCTVALNISKVGHVNSPPWSISRSMMSNETTPSVFLSGFASQMANTMGYVKTFLLKCILFMKLCIDCIYLSFSFMIVVIVLISWLYHNLGQITMFHKWLSVTRSQEALSKHHSRAYWPKGPLPGPHI